MSKVLSRPVVLLILDGWSTTISFGSGKLHTPYYDEICRSFPFAAISNGAATGPEAGHAQIGAGRLIRSEAAIVAEAISSGEFFNNKVLLDAFGRAASGTGSVHLIGLLGDGGVHANSATLYALLRMAKRSGAAQVYVHGILDGRDEPPGTADIYLEALEIKMADIGIGEVATLCGRYFAMDSAENWERTARTYTLLAYAEGERAADPVGAVRSSFLRGLSDEFIPPIVIENRNNEPVCTIKSGDVVIFFNHRGDAIRQLVHSLASGDAAGGKPEVDVICLTEYDPGLGLKVAFRRREAGGTVAAAMENSAVDNFRISDSDRSPHITSIFNCGSPAGSHELAVIVPAASPATRQTEPELKSFKITDKFIQEFNRAKHGVFVVNLPAIDLVAETGNRQRTAEAIQYVDTCLGNIVGKVREAGGVAIITASHGNQSVGSEAAPAVSPTSGDIPFHVIDDALPSLQLRTDGYLTDIGPTLLSIAGVPVPDEMTGRDLRIV